MSFPSTFVDIQNDVIKRMRLDSTADLSWVKDRINTVYTRLCVETGATQTYATMTLTASTSSYTLPTSLVQINQMIVTPVGQTSPSSPLEAITLADLLDRRQGSPTGTPTCYALSGHLEFEVSPIPTDADVLTVWYVAKPTALSADADVPVIGEPWATEVITLGACVEAADFKVDPRRDEYRAAFQDALARYRIHLSRKDGGVATQIMRYKMRRPAHDPSADLNVW